MAEDDDDSPLARMVRRGQELAISCVTLLTGEIMNGPAAYIRVQGNQHMLMVFDQMLKAEADKTSAGSVGPTGIHNFLS